MLRALGEIFVGHALPFYCDPAPKDSRMGMFRVNLELHDLIAGNSFSGDGSWIDIVCC